MRTDRIAPVLAAAMAAGSGCAGDLAGGGGGAETGDAGGAEDSGREDDTGDAEAAIRGMTSWPEGDAPCAAPLLVRVKDSVDGDTAWVAPEDGSRDLDVRFIGVDTPEIDHGDGADCYANEAWAFTARALDGNLAWLTFDAECLDDYDRTLAYVVTGEGDAGFFNRRLAREGYAEPLAIEPNTTFAEDIAADARDARQEGSGLWGECR